MWGLTSQLNTSNLGKTPRSESRILYSKFALDQVPITGREEELSGNAVGVVVVVVVVVVGGADGALRVLRPLSLNASKCLIFVCSP